jgi:8-amino-7-oxononanoate synthase
MRDEKNPYAWIEQAMQTIRRANWYRAVKTVEGRPGAVVRLEGREVLNFASNDYLGLAGDERLIRAAIAATQEFGTGSTGSRLITGHRLLHRELEGAIAQLKQTEDALVFSSGYLANLGAIAALVGQRDLILSDEFNHSSLKNGAILSKATVLEYAHCDLVDLQTKLAQQRDRFRRCLIISDSVFSMDGDLCPLPGLLNLAEQFGCMVLVDEAHATGVLGETGAGCVEHWDCTGRSLVQVGTLSKALGSLGGYVTGSVELIDFLRNRSPGWIYTTGLSPSDTAAALEAIAIIQQEPERRQQLWQNVCQLQQQIRDCLNQATFSSCFKLIPSESPILCLQVADAERAIAIGQLLYERGIFVAAVRPPTVPTSRIRITLMATHQPIHIHQLTAALTLAAGDCWF